MNSETNNNSGSRKRFSLFGPLHDRIKAWRDSFQNTAFYKKYGKYFAPVLFVIFVLSWLIAFLIIGGTTGQWGDAANQVFVKALINNFIGLGPVLIGILIAIGYKLDRRPFTDVFLGFVKGFIGMLILTIGSGILINTARPIFLALSNLGGNNSSTSVVPLDPYFGQTSANLFFGQNGITGDDIVSVIYLALVFGFGLNIILVAAKRFTNLRSIFVTGHIMIQQAGIFSVVIYLIFLFSGVSGAGAFWGTSVLAGITSGVYWAYGSSFNYYATQKVTENAGFAVGHQQMLGIGLAYKVGKYFGRAEDDAENLRLPRFLSIFEDNIFTQTLIISLLFLIFILVIQYSAASDETRFWVWNAEAGTYVTNTAANFGIQNQTGNLSNWSAGGGVFWFYGFLYGIFRIVGSILVIVYGVRIFVTELQQSFTGISSRLIPDATVGVDIAATFGYGQSSVTIGFISGTVGQFVSVAILYGISRALPIETQRSFPIVLPIFITLFFNSGAMGIYANKSGGIRAAIIVPFLFAILEIFMVTAGLYSVNQLFTAQAVNPTLSSPFSVGYNGMSDPNFFFGFLFALMGLDAKLAYLWVGLWIVILLVLAQFIKYHDEEKQTVLYNSFHQLMTKLGWAKTPQVLTASSVTEVEESPNS
ncbi:PTS system ascorbate-specific IIC component [Mycoplasmoides fastidiosum]|uniref:Ascorbate-specific PTS system EIIC component n=1 Tax=Mycoplasmoides fastidiosum TaxID=92758 RepID=A0ABU0LZG4_9BACT|nr:PTS transporter subunit IIC [Mycoplasmoides fastidiosum]MDQ0514100.1 PTS system ascorbate-specific IIC component [Mycoplasmoides fastidiosum]UUD37491.1 PTS ascorbate transporter subunit IIC [Mycoplasmoides fastidiosum]